MNKDRSRISADGGGGDGLPPQPSRRSATPPPEYDISRMPDFPTRNPGHRRAHSEILSLPDDLDLCAPGGGDGPSLSDENDEELFSMFLDVDKLNSSCGPSSDQAESSSAAAAGGGEAARAGHVMRPKHQHSQSMDESMSIKAEDLVGAPGMEGMSTVEAKKAVSAAKLAELALVDPKRAKRFDFSFNCWYCVTSIIFYRVQVAFCEMPAFLSSTVFHIKYLLHPLVRLLAMGGFSTLLHMSGCKMLCLHELRRDRSQIG